MNQKEAAALDKGRVYLCAPLNALMEGIYKEKIPLSQIKEHGDFGLGTFDDLDGEMVMLDGQIFRITSDGRVSQVEEQALTPFSCVTYYQPASHDEMEGEVSYATFLEWLRGLLPSPNIFYAVRIDGRFADVKVRSVPKQDCYRPLVEVAAEQPVFEFSDIEGTLAGFYTPAFLASLSAPGLHLHFLSADLQWGGHVLECQPHKVRVGVQFIYSLELALPASVDYLTWDFQHATGQDLDNAEK